MAPLVTKIKSITCLLCKCLTSKVVKSSTFVSFPFFISHVLHKRYWKVSWLNIVIVLFLGTLVPCYASTAAESVYSPLVLAEAERIALFQSPELQQLAANATAFHEQAVALGQLPDPKLAVGALYVPTNTFSFTQDDMTMVEMGLEQEFPAGRSLAIKSRQKHTLARREASRRNQQGLVILRNVRDAWLDIYYWTESLVLLRNKQSLLSETEKATNAQFASGKITEQSVLAVRLELSRLQEDIILSEQQIAVLRATLARWVGEAAAKRPLAADLPQWSPLPPQDEMQKHLLEHPLIKTETLMVNATQDDIAYAKEQYKPTIAVAASYSVRQGHFTDGKSRSNFIGAGVTVGLPIFPKQRQDRQLKSSEYQMVSAELDRQTRYKDLSSELLVQYANWQALNKRAALFSSQLIPLSKAEATSALKAYESNAMDLASVLRMDVAVLDIELQYLHVIVEKAKTRAALLYLAGE